METARTATQGDGNGAGTLGAEDGADGGSELSAGNGDPMEVNSDADGNAMTDAPSMGRRGESAVGIMSGSDAFDMGSLLETPIPVEGFIKHFGDHCDDEYAPVDLFSKWRTAADEFRPIKRLGLGTAQP